jgi:hypothetical protein
MAHYAELNENNIVIRVLVAEQDFISIMPGTWVQTSYNTRGGIHPEGRPLRKNFAGIGYTYDATLNAFIPPKPFPSWILNEQTCLWECPVPYPENTENTAYDWNEELQQWVPSSIVEAN